MSKLFICGDSFSADPENKYKGNFNYCWSKLLAKKLNAELLNSAIWGASNEFIVHWFLNFFPTVTNDDYVIVQLTEAQRRWFFENEPQVTKLMMIPSTDLNNKKKMKAVETYYKHLYNPLAHNTFFIMSSITIEYFKGYIKNLLILPAWYETKDCIGNLNDVSRNEFINQDKIFEVFGEERDSVKIVKDSRINHLSQPNHEILADKIFNFFNNRQPIDLTKDFVTKIYT